MLTFYQSEFDEHRDWIEKDEYGNIIGMWADYWTTSVEPINQDDISSSTSSIYAEIIYAAKPEIKVEGNGKKFTAKFYNNGTEITAQSGTWSIRSFYIENGKEIDYEFNGKKINDIAKYININTDNPVKIKLDSTANQWIGKSAVVTFTSTSGVIANLDISIVGI